MKRSFSVLLMVGVSLTSVYLSCPSAQAGETMVTRYYGRPDAEVLDESKFLHALSDIHLARNYISRADPSKNEVTALNDIDGVIRSLQLGSVYNCDDYNLHPATDGTLNKYDRYHIGLQILRNVRAYLHGATPDRFSRGYQHRALSQLDAAIDDVEVLVDQET